MRLADPTTAPPVAITVNGADESSTSIPALGGEDSATAPTNAHASRTGLEAAIFFGGIVVSGFIGLVIGYFVLTTMDRRYDFLHLFAEAKPAPSKVVILPPKGITDQPAKVKPAEAIVEPTNTPEPSKVPVPISPSPPSPVAPKPTPVTEDPAPLPTLPPSVEPAPPSPVEPPPPMPTAAEQLAAALQEADLALALRAVDTLALEEEKDGVRSRLDFLTSATAAKAFPPDAVAGELLLQIESALEKDKHALAATYIDRLLILARQLDDRDVLRRATLLTVKIREGAKK
jgi:hypothetical protein